MLYAVFVVIIEVENFEKQVEKLTDSMKDERVHFECQLNKIKKESITAEKLEDEVARQLNEKMQKGYFIIIKKISFSFVHNVFAELKMLVEKETTKQLQSKMYAPESMQGVVSNIY